MSQGRENKSDVTDDVAQVDKGPENTGSNYWNTQPNRAPRTYMPLMSVRTKKKVGCGALVSEFQQPTRKWNDYKKKKCQQRYYIYGVIWDLFFFFPWRWIVYQKSFKYTLDQYCIEIDQRHPAIDCILKLLSLMAGSKRRTCTGHLAPLGAFFDFVFVFIQNRIISGLTERVKKNVNVEHQFLGDLRDINKYIYF